MLWYNAKVRDTSVGITLGTKVLVALSTEQHTSIGKCWWIYDGEHLRQVAESFGGRDLYRIISRGRVFGDQPRMHKRFTRLHTAYERQRYGNAEKTPKTKQKSVI